MKKLDDIPKKNIFEVPDDYFDRLPMKIQARLETPDQTRYIPVWNLAVRYALPIVIVGLVLVYFLRPNAHQTEELLASISNEHLIAYLNETDISVNELLDIANFNESDADSLSQHLNDTLLGDFDPDSYRDEFKSALENEL
jgi:hypothetical protein